MANGLQKTILLRSDLPNSVPLSLGSVSISIGSPAVISLINNKLNTGDVIYFTISSGGIFPTGISAGIKYFVKVITSNTFQISLTSGGTSIVTSGSTSGTITAIESIYYTRYRIISKDKNRYSHWSPIYKVNDQNPIILLPGAGIDGGTV